MKTALIIIGSALLLILVLLLTWKAAKIHELHEIKSSFDQIREIYDEKYGDQENLLIRGFEIGRKVILEHERLEKQKLL